MLNVLARTSVAALLIVGIGPPAHAQFGALSEDDEVTLGREAAAEIEKDLTLLHDDRVGDYITRLGRDLAAASDRPGLDYRFTVVNAPDVNAFALPGGFIYVNRGLIEAADNESELAGVLGHEIGHVVARHGAEQMQRAQLTGLGLSVLDRLLGRGAGGAIGRVAAQMVASGAFMKFSRDAEREADRLGTHNLIATDHDPRGMVTFFQKLAAMRERDPNAVERFFASHPSPDERADNVNDLLGGADRRAPGRLDTAAFRAAKQRLLDLPRPPADGGR